jgi:flagellar biosynthesis/type III secretory pathway protein FliH
VKTQKQVEAIEATLNDTIAKLTEDGHQEIYAAATHEGLRTYL